MCIALYCVVNRGALILGKESGLMKILQSILICLILVSTTSCAWIGRDYYYDGYGDGEQSPEGWVKRFEEGIAGGKRAPVPDTMTYTYENDSLELNVNVGYQEMTVFGPVIIPVIPLLWEYPDNLSVGIEIVSNALAVFDFTSWKLRLSGTGVSYSPVAILMTEGLVLQDYNDKIPADLKIEGRRFVRLLYPVKFSEAESIELSFGDIYIDDQKVTPEKIQLKKIKGNWHYIQFTL